MVRRPFSSIPDIEAYYPSLSAETARDRLFRTLDRGEGVALLFGEAGLGKTLLFRLLKGKFELDAPVLLFSSARISDRRSLYLQILFQLHCDFASSDEDELRIRFFEHLRRSEYPYYIFLFDNADTLPFPVFDEVRSLLDVENHGVPRFRTAFAGTARFEERLNSPRFARFSQRIISRSWLEPFTRDETADYIGRQMKRAAEDYNGLSFDTEAAKQVHRYSEGIPRVVNQICDLALYLNEGARSVITEQTVRRAWGLLQQIPEDDAASGAGNDLSGLPACTDAGDSPSVVEFGELDSSFDEGPVPEPPERQPSDFASGAAVEFATLDDEPEPSESIPAQSFPTESEDADDVIPFVPKKALPEETPSFDSKQTEFFDGDPDGTVSLSGRTIHWDGNPSFLRADGRSAEDSDNWDGSELIDRSGADRTYNSIIREELLKDFPKEDKAGGCVSVPDANDADFPGETERCMEELRLMEIEVSQAREVIGKIRKMQTGLDSFDRDEDPLSEQDALPEENGLPQDSSKPRPFFRVFEKIYTKDRKDG